MLNDSKLRAILMNRMLLLRLTLLLGLGFPMSAQAVCEEGVYQSHCARCHDGGVNGGVQWGMASDGRNVYSATSDAVRRGAAGW